MKRRAFTSSLLIPLACASLTSLASVAMAQDSSSSAAAAQTSQQGPMIVERLHSGFLAAPDVKITNVDHSTSALAGGYAGWLADEAFFIGGGGYWLANNHSDRKMAYGGVVVGLMGRTDRTIGGGVKALFGGGQATLGTTITDFVFPQPVAAAPGQRVPPPQPVLRSVTLRQQSDFFVAEPEADLFVNFSRHVRLVGGVGYRFIGDRAFDRRLRGVTGSVSLQIGG